MIAGHRRPFAHHLGWSALGTVFPALAALWAVPHYTRVLGAEGFALLALVWVLVGWLSVADLGLSRAVTQGVARALASGHQERAAAVTWSALAVLVPVAAVVAACVALLAPWIAGLLRVDAALLEPATRAIRWAALALPVTLVMTALRGVLEGAREFRVVALLRVPFGVAFALVPLWMATPSGSVAVAVAGIVLVRTAAMLAHFAAARTSIPALGGIRFLAREEWRALVVFGGWTTVVTAVGSALIWIDRIGLGALVSLTLLAPYAVASEAIMKVWLLAAVIVPVQYAWFSSLLTADRRSAVAHYASGVRLISLAGFAMLAVVVVVAGPGMNWWVGAPLAADAAIVLRWMAVGVMANLGAQVAQSLVQAAGRPEYTAWGYLVEFPLMVAALAIVVPRAGALGAALVWTTRFVVDAVWCLVAAEIAVPEARRARAAAWGWCFGTTVVVAGLAFVVAR